MKIIALYTILTTSATILKFRNVQFFFIELQQLNVVGFHLHARSQQLRQLNKKTANAAAAGAQQVPLTRRRYIDGVISPGL